MIVECNPPWWSIARVPLPPAVTHALFVTRLDIDEVAGGRIPFEHLECTLSNQSGPLSLFRKRDLLPVSSIARCA